MKLDYLIDTNYNFEALHNHYDEHLCKANLRLTF